MAAAVEPPQAAGLGRRFIALVLDWGASLLIARLAFPQFPYGSLESSAATLAIFATEVILLTWLTGASFGQRLVGLRIEPLHGGRLTLVQVVVRTVLLCLVLPAVIYDSQGRGLHDRAAGTICVRAGTT
ncbi:MAG: hypothetical protein RJB01_204 [Actinomycetota bacterium]